MKLVERKNKLTDGFGIYLEDIHEEDVSWMNLEGKPDVNSAYYNPKAKPKHYITLKFQSEEPGHMEILKALQAVNVNVSAPRSEYDTIMNSKSESQYIREMKERLTADKRLAAEYQKKIRYYVQFRAYPSVKQVRKVDYRTGQEVVADIQKPRVMVRSETGSRATQFMLEQFAQVDSANIVEMIFKFHLYKYDEHKPNVVPALDEVHVVTKARQVWDEDQYAEDILNKKYGVPAPAEEEPVPFK